MGEFVYLFGGIEKKRLVDRELNALEEIDRQKDAQQGVEQVADDAGTGSVPFRNLDALPGSGALCDAERGSTLSWLRLAV